MVWPPPCTGGNKARGVLAGSLIVKTVESIWERLAGKHSVCAWGRPGAIHGVTQSGAWPLQGIPYEGLQRGLGGSLYASRYLGKNIGVIDRSLHISTLLFSFHIYIDYITPFEVEIATH